MSRGRSGIFRGDHRGGPPVIRSRVMRCGELMCFRAVVSSLLLVALLGCTDDEQSDPIVLPPTPPEACAATERELPDGSCISPGIAADACAEGFVHDGDVGCEAILPPQPCLPGRMAVPGDESCRPVMVCGAPPWGDTPRDGTTQYVDASYGGGANDGSELRPWINIGDAVAAAQSGAVVAIAPGSYVENVRINAKQLHIWGICPDLVEIVGSSGAPAALTISSGAHGSSVQGVALTGGTLGLILSGAVDVLIDRVWAHDTAWRGMSLQSGLGTTAAVVSNVLVENTIDIGMSVSGADVLFDGVEVRGTLPYNVHNQRGRGITVQTCEPIDACNVAVRAHATVRRSLLSDNLDAALWVSGSDLEVEATVMRRTLQQASDQLFGRGLGIQACTTLDGCAEFSQSNAVVRGSLIDDNLNDGVFVSGSTASLDTTVVRNSRGDAALNLGGRGIAVQTCREREGCATPVGSVMTISNSLISNTADVALFVAGSQLDMQRTLVRGTRVHPATGFGGRALNVQLSCNTDSCEADIRSNATVRECAFEDNHEIAVAVVTADLMLERSTISRTLPTDNALLFGDGVAVFSFEGPAGATLTSLSIHESTRAGISNFGGALSLAQTAINCAAFELHGENYEQAEFSFVDGGNNLCGCPVAEGECRVASTALQPPVAATN